MRGRPTGVNEAETVLEAMCSARPNTVREKLARYQDLAGFNNFPTKTQIDTMSNVRVRENIAAVPEEVQPYFKDRLPEPGAREDAK